MHPIHPTPPRARTRAVAGMTGADAGFGCVQTGSTWVGDVRDGLVREDPAP
jgi:hypothetical protein